MSDDIAIELRGVRFTPDGATHPVLDGVDLVVRRGEWVLVMGPSGGGKTTLALTMNGIVPHLVTGAFEGDVIVSGRSTRETPVASMATSIGMVFQDPDGQIVHETVRDEVYFGLENLQREPADIVVACERSLREVGMLDLRDAEVMSLSGGQKQRVSLASVLALGPAIIVLDEPTANLDPQGMRDVFEVIARIRRERDVTIVMVEHHVDELAELVDRLIVVDEGRIVHDGPPAEVFTAVAPVAERRALWLPQVSEIVHALDGAKPGGLLPISVEACVAELDRRLASGPAHGARVTPVVTPVASATNGASPRPTASADPILQVRNLSYAYGTAAPVLRDVSLSLERGGITAICGPNGSGKTTLAKCITRINAPAAGTIFLDGADVTKLSHAELSSQVGYVFQNPDHQFVADTVYDELAYSLRVRKLDGDEIRERVERMLGLMDLVGREEESPFGLSVGERRRLSVATMLILGQKLLVLDEPTIGQDLARSEALFGILDELCREVSSTMVFITHDMRLVADWCQRTVVMAEGVVQYDGPTSGAFVDADLLARAHLIAPPVIDVSRGLRARGHGVSDGAITVAELRAFVDGAVSPVSA
ncbi:MAG TPA: ABC transporter ATP-binding protein [Candidatus Limnocylindrales bacterium]